MMRNVMCATVCMRTVAGGDIWEEGRGKGGKGKEENDERGYRAVAIGWGDGWIMDKQGYMDVSEKVEVTKD